MAECNMVNDICSECAALLVDITSGEGANAMQALKTAATNACSLQLVKELQSEKGKLKVTAGNNLKSSCDWERGAIFKGTYSDAPDENTTGGDKDDVGYYYNVTLTQPIDVGGTAPSDKLKFVWLKGRVGKSGKDLKEYKEAPWSWFYKSPTEEGKMPTWKGSAAFFSPSFTFMSASVTGASLGFTGLSLSFTGLDVVLAAVKVLGWVVFDDGTVIELNLHGIKSSLEKLATIGKFCSISAFSFVKNNEVTEVSA